MNPENPKFGEGPATTEQGTIQTQEKLSPEQEEQAKHWMEQTRKELEAKSQEKRMEPAENERILSELKEIFETWLIPEKLNPLIALKTEVEAMASPERKEAKLVLAEIQNRIKTLSGVPIEALKEKYRVLSRAVGIINSGLVDHTR